MNFSHCINDSKVQGKYVSDRCFWCHYDTMQLFFLYEHFHFSDFFPPVVQIEYDSPMYVGVQRSQNVMKYTYRMLITSQLNISAQIL